MTPEYVSFFGSIGVGKTTAGKEVARRFPQVDFVEEGLGENPYLSRFYEDMHTWGFLSTLEMLRMMSGQFELCDKSKEVVVLDNGIRELICYARLEHRLGILSHDQFATYQRLYQRMLELTPELSLYVFFHCDEEIQLRRIQQRGRRFEQDLDPSFLRMLNQEYARYVEELPKEKVLWVNTNTWPDHSALGQEIFARTGKDSVLPNEIPASH